jgi:NADPH:quinone reductase-like Zn-dependent oxidoreductase
VQTTISTNMKVVEKVKEITNGKMADVVLNPVGIGHGRVALSLLV